MSRLLPRQIDSRREPDREHVYDSLRGLLALLALHLLVGITLISLGPKSYPAIVL